MAYPWSSFFSENRDVIKATWSGIEDNGIFEYDQVARMVWEDLETPYAVMDIASMDAADWGIGNEAYEVTVAYHYITRESMSVVRAKIEALKNALWAATFTTSQATLLETGQDWSGANPMNQIFLAKNIPFRGGILVGRFVLGETQY